MALHVKMKYQDHLNSLTQFTTSQPLKNVTKFLVSVSIFSFIISYSDWCSFLLHYVNFYHFLAFPWKLLSHALDKGYIFLICNGILLIIAKTSSLVVRPPSGPDFYDDGLQTSSKDLVVIAKPEEDVVVYEGGRERENQKVEEREEGEVDEDEYFIKEEHIENYGSSFIVEDEKKLEPQNDEEVFNGGKGEEDEEGKDQEHVATYILGDDDEVEKDYFDNGVNIIEDEGNDEEEYKNVIIVEEDNKGEEEEMELLSTEELNKKFDEFIRRMKQDLRIEAQQQLVVVK